MAIDFYGQFSSFSLHSAFDSLTTVLYGETDTPALAGVVIRIDKDDRKKYKDMHSIAGVKACVNEYNGIGK